ncbi:hypothetical protein P9112_005769 [Eukaryota sp. TZLM1-RC]
MSISFKRACFGLKNVPAVFQNMMMEIFDSEGVFIYIDDIIIVASTLDEFLSRVGTVLERAKRFRVNLGLPKCSFTTCKHEIKILGSIFVNKTRYIDESRIKGLINLPKPRTLPEVRSFIGSINYIQPINKLTRNKPSKIKWTSDHDEASGKIINLIKANIPLELPSEDKHILISADASDVAVGGVIWQEANPPKDPTTPLIKRKVVPIAFFSRLLSTSQKNWSVLQKEFSLENYLISRKLTIFTDHRNLAYLISAAEKNRIVKRWLPILSEFNFDVVHTAGEENYWADMLSRLVDIKPKTPRVQQVRNLAPHRVEEQLPYLNLLTRVNLLRDDITQPSTIELPTINSLSALKEAVEDTKFDLFDTWISKIRQEQLIDVDSNPDYFKDYKYNSDIQLYTNNRGKIVIPDSLEKQTLTIIHGHANVGHPSVTASVKKLLNSNYFWPDMRKDMINHIKRCPACQRTAHVPKNVIESSGSLWADRPFARLNADNFGPLQQDDNGFKYLIVFVDSFTRLRQFKNLFLVENRDCLSSLVYHPLNVADPLNDEFFDLCEQHDIRNNDRSYIFEGLIETFTGQIENLVNDENLVNNIFPVDIHFVAEVDALGLICYD